MTNIGTPIQLAGRPRRTLFQIGDDMIALMDLLDEAGGDITEEEAEAAINAWFAEIKENLAGKVDGYCGLIKEYEAQAAIRKEESARVGALAKADENRAKRLKARLQQFMEFSQLPKITTDHFNVAVQKNGGKDPLIMPEEIEATMLPAVFHKVTVSVDTDVVRRALESPDEFVAECLERGMTGEQVQEALSTISSVARIGERGTHLRIR